MENSNNNISPEIIDFYMKKSQQERSDFIYEMFARLKRQISDITFATRKDYKKVRTNARSNCEIQTSHSV